MWKPNEEGLQELMNLFKESKSINNIKQNEIYKKINEYSNHQDFTKYLIYILNSNQEELQVRQVAGLSLKGIMERQFVNLTEEALEYFKDNILSCYLDKNQTVRKTISNLINTFIRLGGMEMWPEILNFLLQNLDTEIGVGMSLETLNIIIEDSGSYLEEKYSKFLLQLLPKLTDYLEKMGNTQNDKKNDELIILVLSTVYVLLENCPNAVNDEMPIIINVLLNLNNSQNLHIRYNLGRCWLTIIRMKKDVLLKLFENLYMFNLNNFSMEYYEMNFISAEFFLFLIEEVEEDFLKEEVISNIIQQNMKQLVVYIMHYMKLTPNDIYGLENKLKTHSKNSNTTQQSGMTNESTKDGEDYNSDDELDENTEGYNPNWTLRKCCSKVLDRLSNLYPQKIYEITKQMLENDMQHSDWMVKESSILALGAMAVGSYSFLKPHLATLISFLIRELQHPHKLVRAISLWTLSRFTRFILIDNLSENSYELFKDYLCECLKKFLDKEIIVQEAACTAFCNMILIKKEKLEPYLFDIFKIITNVLDKYSGSSLLTLYDIIAMMTEHFQEHFKNQSLIEELINNVVKRWYDMVKQLDYKNLSPLFEIMTQLIKVSSNFTQQYFDYFFNGNLIIIENSYLQYINNNNDINFLDKELINRSIDMMSVLCQQFPNSIRENTNKNKIVEFIFNIVEINDFYMKHYLIALVGDLAKADQTIFTLRFEKIINIIFENLEVPLDNNNEMEKLSVCNNSCWTIGLLAIYYPEQTKVFVAPILRKLLKMLTVPRLNKSLAQNISICIGRLSLIDPVSISNHLDSFLKQFCLSLRYIKDSQEKREAFHGLCKAIVHNPNGVMNFFAFFCDAICQYDDAPEELENVFQNIIASYKNTLREKWMDYINLFPEKLKLKMAERLKI